MSEFINADCMEYLPKYPENYFDLAICDPPYGGGFTADAADGFGNKRGRFGGVFDKYFKIDAGGGRFDAHTKREVWKNGRDMGSEVPDEWGYV